ncbi:MAG TPA: class I SAM-dependent methyltransferase [Caulobacteraceae bacterium]|jgi:23S rRNA (cytosine1962-C5)-methyltransferase|nr:class I SAM-dependent methyltransferase [Caulobacteraceae bacterium]
MAKGPVIAAAPLALATRGWPDYALLDSGGGRKLERLGERRLIRPEPQCLWRPHDPQAWTSADAAFEAGGEGDDDDAAGRWRRQGDLSQSWALSFGQVRFAVRLTSFRHLGVFPEHAANWRWIAEQLARAGRPLRVLNLFGYTGVASLAAAAAGAEVTHVDASKKAVQWARENAGLSDLAAAPIRWICEDARTWVRREIRRGAAYDAIILDPPKFGRGPGGEVWRLYDDLAVLVAGCAALLSPDARFLLLNAYAERITGVALAGLMSEALTGRGGGIEFGELDLMEETGERGVGLSFFARWVGS